jgi:hypothetical protein
VTALGLGGLLFYVLALGGCLAAGTKEQHTENAIKWAAAWDCEKRFSTIRVEMIDSFGRLHVELRGAQQTELEAFNACWFQRIDARTKAMEKKQ